MKKIILCASLLMITAGSGFNLHCKSFRWEFLELFKDTNYTNQGMKKVMEYEPDKDILQLPPLYEKDFFASIDDLSICRREDVRKFLYIYLTHGRGFVIKSIKRSGNYLNAIEKEFDANTDIPKEIMLLPLLESGFNPYAVSRSRAVGLWQFLRSTSKIFGLKNNYWVDERRDVVKSTRAAIQHLLNLNSIFNSWEHALAAYNGGGAHVKRSMRKAGKSDFWDLQKSDTLRRETNEYVPRFAALLIIYKNQKLFGLTEEIGNIKNINLNEFTFNGQINIRDYSKLYGVPVKIIKMYNPELKRNKTPPYYKRYCLNIPEEYAKRIVISMVDEISDNRFQRL